MFFGSTLAVRMLGIASIAILGRLLTPTDFGVFAYAVFATGLLEAVVNRNLELGLIRLREVAE